MLLHLLLRRGAGVSSVPDRFGLLAVAVHTDLVVRAYVFLGGSYQRLTQPTTVVGRDAACFTCKAGAYRSLRGRETVLYG